MGRMVDFFFLVGGDLFMREVGVTRAGFEVEHDGKKISIK